MGTKDRSVSFPARGSSATSGFWGGPSLYASNGTITVTRTRTGTALPRWRQVIAEGGNATTPMTAVWDEVLVSPGSANLDGFWIPDPSYWQLHTMSGLLVCQNGQINRRVINPTADTSFADNQARAKFYKAIRQTKVQMSGPTFLGELREALHMIRRPAAVLWNKNLNFIEALGKRKRLNPRGWTKDISGLWLEYSFGWVPLINDIRDGVEAWGRLTEKPRIMKISKSFQQFIDKTGTLRDDFHNGPLPYCNTNIVVVSASTLVEEVIVRYKGAVRVDAKTTQWDKWALFGFTPSEFIPTAWELTPWSFLIDYFTNIGDILNATVTDTSNLLWVNKTVIQKSKFDVGLTVDVKASLARFGSNYGGGGGGQPGKGTFKRKTVSRTANSGLPLPSLQFSFDLSNGQLFNIAALLGQARALHPQNPRPWQSYIRGRPGR